MVATIVNALAIIAGGMIGSLFGSKINEKYTSGIMLCMAMIVAVIGMQGAVATTDILCLVICCVTGTVLGTTLSLDDLINSSGDKIKARLSRTAVGKGSFGDAFVTTTLLFGVGTMTILGSVQAGINRDYGILFTKSVMDFVSAIAFSAALGPGVIFSALPIFVFQGTITLLAGFAEPYLTKEVIVEMSAAGGPIFIGMAVNMLELRNERIKIGNMLPSIFLPIVYIPLVNLLKSLF